MAITVTFYKDFQKKLNSTKVPVSSADDITLSVEMKDIVNLFTPALIVSADTFMENGQIKNPMRYNYCYIADFERYFFVRSWSWVLGRWECALEVDVLSSFKTEIGESSLYVLRAYSKFNGNIVDTKYPVEAVNVATNWNVKTYGSATSPWNTNIYNAAVTDGFYVVSIVNNDSGAIGAVSHYAFAPAVMAELMNKLYAAPTWMNIQDANISEDLQKMLFNPMQYITQVHWIPTGFNTSGATGIHTIPYGWWSLTLTGTVYKINTTNVKKTISIDLPIPNHPQVGIGYRRRYLQLSPYTTAALYFPPFGFIPLDTTKLYMCDAVHCSVVLDVLTGKGTLLVNGTRTEDGLTASAGTCYATTAQVGVPISIAQMSVDMSALGQASTWVSAAGVALAAGGLQDSLKDLKNGLIDGVRDIFSDVQSRTRTPAGNPNTMEGRLKIGLAQAQAIGQGGIAGEIQAGLQRGLDSIGGGKSLLSSLKEIAGDIGSAALAAAGQCQSSGSTGGFAALQERVYIQWYFQKIVETNEKCYGYPLCETVKINTLSGFILCQSGDGISVTCTPTERQAICGFMEAGFYYE